MSESGGISRVLLIPALIVTVLLTLVLLGWHGVGGNIVGAVPGTGSGAGLGPPPAGGPPVGGGQPVEGRSVEGSAGTVLVDGAPMLPLAAAADVGLGGDLSAFGGHEAVGVSVRVQSVVADEGFWIGTSTRDRVWVQLVGPPPESPYQVRKGDTVSFRAPVRKNSAGFAHRVGVSASEGAAMLTAQKQHISVWKKSLKLSP